MAVVGSCGFNSQQAAGPEGENPSGTFSYSTAIKRSGIASMRLNPASGNTGTVDTTSFNGTNNYLHWGFYIASMPTVPRLVAGDSLTANTANILLNLDQTLSLRNSTTVIGTTAALNIGQWYFIGLKNKGSGTGVLMQLDGVDVISGTYPTSGFSNVGCSQVEASAIDIYIDDLVVDGAGFLSNAKIAFVRPVSDGTRVAWTAGAGGTTNLWQGLDLQPPGGLASANETNSTNIESASNTGTANFTVNLAAYDTLGITAADTILGVQIAISHGEDIATGTKNFTFEGVSNPVITVSSNLAFGGDLGAHGVDTVGVGNWQKVRSVFVASPALTLSSGPAVKFIKTDTTTRVGCIDYCAMNVVYTPAVGGGQVPYRNPMPPLIAQ